MLKILKVVKYSIQLRVRDTLLCLRLQKSRLENLSVHIKKIKQGVNKILNSFSTDFIEIQKITEKLHFLF